MSLASFFHQRGNKLRLRLLGEIEIIREEVNRHYLNGQVTVDGMNSVYGFLDDSRLYLEIGKDRYRMPGDWVEKNIKPSVDELLLFSHAVSKV